MTQNKRLRLFFSDHLGLPRGKYTPLKPNVAGGTSRFCLGIYVLTYSRTLTDAPGGGLTIGLPDMEARYSSADIRTGWEEDTDVVICDQFDAYGQPLALCGRGALKRAVAEWQKLGLNPKLGIELEAYIFERNSQTGAYQPAAMGAPFVYSTGPINDPNGFMDELWHRATEAGFKIESFQTEFDPGQVEFALVFDDAVKAVDEIFLFKIMAREVAHQCGLVLSFMPKPILSLGGSGVHYNISLADQEGKNALGDAHRDDLAGAKMSKIMRGATAGMVRHHRALAGILAPTMNSYQRLQPASLSGYWQNWGYDHRGVTVRLSAEAGAKSRIEHRMADAGCNLYTAAAALLQAARLGFIHDYELPLAETGDCINSQDSRDSVAGSLLEALNDLAADTALCEALGPELVTNHIAIKKFEAAEVTALADETAKRDYYLPFV
ncbi:MAG: glutamine synthetase family protein [Candidatus Pacebacteria bacterium]|nr:glutamine synthetase family protein [Candidatus Paceibacterota bacterium]